jgi:L-aminopeptidase/D-esterase-like protein
VGETPHFWAAPFEIGDEFGGLGLPSPFPPDAATPRWKWQDPASAGANTTIAIIATDAKLTKPEAKRLAIAAHDGFARAIWPAHSPVDGDLVFALATGHERDRPRPLRRHGHLCACGRDDGAGDCAGGV